MIRFLFRLASSLALAAAVIFGVIDSARSLGASKLVLTPLGQSWFETSPDTLTAAQAIAQRSLPAWVWDPGILAILTLPGWTVFLALSFLLYAIGRKPARRLGRFTAAA